MKTLVLFLLTVYKVVVSPLIHQLVGQKSLCRYEISCSEYAKQVIEKHGIIKGVKMALVRFLNCQPFNKSYATV